MIYGTNKLKRKVFIAISIVAIAVIIIALCAQAVINNNLENTTSIIAGREVAKNDITQTIDQFDWEQDVDPQIGSITIEDNGKTVHMTGNRTLPGQNAIYIIPESHQEQIFSFDYNVEYGDSFNAAGVLLRIKKIDNYYQVETYPGEEETFDALQGYMISFNNPNAQDMSWFGGYGVEILPENKHLGAIWKVTYILGANYGQDKRIINKTLVKWLDLPQSGSMTVTSNPTQIVVTGTDINETIEISEDDEVGDGFGFFTNHYSHSCDRIGEFNLTNFAVTVVDIEPHNLYVDPNGGTWNDSSEVSTIVGEYKDEVDIPLPTRPGYNFAGWTQTGNSGSMSSLTEDAIYTFGEDAETDDTLTAQWTKIDIAKEQRIDMGEDYGDITPENPNSGGVTYVIEDQQIIYTLTATNVGTVDGTALIQDTAPEGTTFVENSIKINDEETTYTEEDLANGISVPVPKDTSATLSFKVKIKELPKGEKIENTATYKDITITEETEEKETNNVEMIYFNTYGEPILSYSKSMLTEKGESYVTSGEKITYKINISNIGLVPLELTVKDQIPVGTTYLEDSLKVNNATYTKEDGSNATIKDLENGLKVTVPEETTNYSISFAVTVNDGLEDGAEITNTATIDGNTTNTTTIKYGGSSITADKIAETQFKKNYVVYGERITYSIIIKNAGSVEKEVILKDVLPEEITLVDGSIKLDEKALKNEQGLLLSAEDLEKGISILVPSKAVGSNKPGETILSFIATVNDLEDGDTITNIATVDDMETNSVSHNYVENRLEDDEGKITQTKEIETEYGKDYVVEGEKIKVTIKIENDGTTSKDVEVKDTIPQGTTFIDGSIKIDGDIAVDDNGDPITEEDLENGLIVNVEDETTITYEVVVNKLEDGDVIESTPATVDGNKTNEVTIEYSNNNSSGNPDDDNNPDNPSTDPDDDNNPDNPSTDPDDDNNPNENPSTDPDDDNNPNNPNTDPDDDNNPDNPNTDPDDDNNPDNPNTDPDDDNNSDNPNINIGDNQNNNQNNNSNNNSNNNNGNTSGNGKDTTTANENIPKTGFRNILVIVVIVILSGTIIFYIRYKKLNTYVK